MKTKTKIKWLLFLPLLIFGNCTNLNEELFDRLTPGTFYKNDKEALASLVGVYQKMRDVYYYNSAWRGMVIGTDEFIIPARTNGGFYDGGQYLQFVDHSFDADNELIAGAWQTIFGVIGAANYILQSFEESPNAKNLAGPIAEVRGLRAMTYYVALDFWGNVPIFTKSRIDPSSLPATNSRIEVFEFVENEMIAAAADLPSITEVDRAGYYPRLTKEAVYTALAKLYLNAQVYTGNAKWAETIDMCNKVIAKEGSNGYLLEPVFITNFDENNDKSKELISSFSFDPSLNAGGNRHFRGTMHPDHKKVYNLSFAPAGGHCTLNEAFNRYEANDIRRKYIVWGPQFYLDGVTPLKDTQTNIGKQLVLIPIVDYTSSESNEGYRVMKYYPGTFIGRDASNDIVLQRYSDILLMKAEALLRSGGSANEALDLVNRVRARSNATPFTSAEFTLHDILDERGREFLWECSRRTDMIRFGDYFTGRWQFKTTDTPEWRGIYPIPNKEIISNPNLIQNPNY
jgi:starch-binding outer membrane protein, SusD/RagB family